MTKKALSFLLVLPMLVSAKAADVREKRSFSGEWNLHQVRRVSFTMDCDNEAVVRRSYVYLKSGRGYYQIPFTVERRGQSLITIDRADCIREEGEVEGWRRISEVMVSFWRPEGAKIDWSIDDFKPLEEPYDCVVVTADEVCHPFAAELRAIGLRPLMVNASEVDAELLRTVKLIVRIGGRREFPDAAKTAVAEYLAAGGHEFSVTERLRYQHDPEGLSRALERCAPELAPVLGAARAHRAEVRARGRKAAAEFPEFMRSGGDAELRAIYCHTAYGPERVKDESQWSDWNRSCAYLKSLGFNTLVVNVARGGIAFYDSKVLPMSPEVAEKGDAIDLLKSACDRNGLRLVLWKVCFRSRKGMKTPEFERWIAEGRGAKSAKGELDDEWLCPSRPENRNLELDALVELAKRWPWMVELDYIRYAATDWCFCDHCRKAFERQLGQEVADWPESVLKEPGLTTEWRRFRIATITSVVREASERIRAEAPGVKIRADVFRYPDGDALTVAQDWSDWTRRGYLDMVAPMDGTESASELARMVAMQRAAAAPVPMTPTVYPSIWKNREKNAADLMEMIRTVRAAGTPGFGVFTFDGRFIEMMATDKEIGK